MNINFNHQTFRYVLIYKTPLANILLKSLGDMSFKYRSIPTSSLQVRLVVPGFVRHIRHLLFPEQ